MSPTTSSPIVEEITIDASAERVFEALISPEERVKWNDGVTTVRLTHSGLTAEALRTGHRGWPQILAWLRAHAERLERQAVD